MSPTCFGLKNEFGFLILQEAEGNEEEEPADKDEVDEEETERLEIEKKRSFFLWKVFVRFLYDCVARPT